MGISAATPGCSPSVVPRLLVYSHRIFLRPNLEKVSAICSEMPRNFLCKLFEQGLAFFAFRYSSICPDCDRFPKESRGERRLRLFVFGQECTETIEDAFQSFVLLHLFSSLRLLLRQQTI